MPPVRSSPALTRRRYSQHKWHSSTIRCILLASILFVLTIWMIALLGLDTTNNSDTPSEIIEATNIKQTQNIKQIINSNANAASSMIHTIPNPRATIAYAVSLTSCGVTTNRHDNIKNGGHSSDPSFSEGAAVLQHSIHLSSIRNYHESKSLFDYEVSTYVVYICFVYLCISLQTNPSSYHKSLCFLCIT